jgi:hypothetical protein
VGPWFVAVAVLLQGAGPPNTSAGTNSGAPGWWPVVAALAIVATAVAAIFGILYRLERQKARVEIDKARAEIEKVRVEVQAQQQTTIESLNNTVERLQRRNAELYAEIEGVGLGQVEAQAHYMKFQDEARAALQEQISSLQSQNQQLNDSYSQTIKRLTKRIRELSEENRLMRERLPE